ncbi:PENTATRICOPEPTIDE REPEAT-CONTAINING PROTEIN [Salix koriyanagi]|uniref:PENTATRICOPEPTIDE REPEAT-CONTAINING PROTEIN n=1 Tax=Salix koriyanagi TaxID=2511006 RepID=A0A9Q0TR13_9ROSI|nr:PENTATRICOPEPTIDE REPEAT-CONTAINING PROTEIN [Salix koriyanagi]
MGVRLDDHTFPFVLKACADNLSVQKGREIHGVVFKLGFDSDVFVGNTLLLFYGNCGTLKDVKRVFDEMPERDAVSWNSIIGVFSVRGFYAEAIHLFCEMNLRSGFRPNMTGLDSQVTVGNALVDVYGKCGYVEDSRRVFDEISERNGVSWNAIITSLAYLERNHDALEMFRLMIDGGVKPNSVTLSSTLPVLIGEKNIVSWNAMVANLAQNRLESAAVDLVRQMQADGEIPNSVTFTNVLPACARIGFLRPGKEIHARAIRIGSSVDLFVSNALTDMYAKCGCLNLARKVFTISLRDEVSYNILIIGYSQTTDCSESLSLFLEMGRIKGMKLDVVSYMGVISACANLAALKQGKEVHGLAVRKHLHTQLFIANSLLDFYIKCGRIDLAGKVFHQIPRRDTASWNSMILGYGMLGELTIAIDLFEAMKEDGVEYDSVSSLIQLFMFENRIQRFILRKSA